MKRLLILLLLMIGMSAAAFARSGIVHETSTNYGNGIIKTILFWQAGADSLFSPYDTQHVFAGMIWQVVTVPDTSASTYSADNLDFVINNSDSLDVMRGALANRDSIATETVAPVLSSGTEWPLIAAGKLRLKITNFTRPCRGRIVIYELPRR